MAGFGKGARPGKRGSSSSGYSPYVSTVTMVVFVAFCLLGVWMLTSSSIIPSHAIGSTARVSSSSSSSSSSTATSRLFLRDPTLTEMDDKPGDLPEDAVKGDSEPATEEEVDDKSGSRDALEARQHDSGAGAEAESRSESKVGEEFEEENRNHLQQHTEEETPRKEEETRQVQEQEQAGGNEEAQQQESEEKGVHNQQQEEHDSDGTTDGGQQQEESGIREEQQTGVEQHSSQEEQPTGNNGEENQQESQDLGNESGGDDNQEQSQTATEENQDHLQQQQMEDGGGETESLSERKMEEGTDEKQSESQQLNDAEGSSEDQQQPSQQQIEEDRPTVTSDEAQQPNEEQLSDPNAGDSLPDGAQSEVSNDGDGKKRPWATQADHSDNEKERRKEEAESSGGGESGGGDVVNLYRYDWELCNVTAGPDYIPCLDNTKAIKQLHSLRHYEHRERHCPDERPTCLVPLPKGYKHSIEWPKSRDRIWYNNVPHPKLAEVKGHQNWVKVTGQYLTFPGGGTQFIRGALHYIDFIQQAVRDIAWGKHTRVILDVGCGVASFGGYLFDRDVLTMSFAPKDEHEAQVQFALERGIPAISAVMGSQRLQFPGRVFDIVHCARCRVPWHADGGTLLLELNRVLRPGGYFVWSATPVYQKLKEDVEIWKAMMSLTKSMCWDLVTIKKDRLNSVAAAIYRKPTSNECYDKRKHNSPPMCKADDDPSAAWYIPLEACMHRVPVDASERGSKWPEVWPRRLKVPPYWLNSSQIGVYGKPAPEDFTADYEHWKGIVRKSYLSGLGISWSKVRNVMDMRAVYGGFAAALQDLKVWVMNVVNIDSPDTLPIIYERGLFGIYHDWCESFSTYPRTYDLLHADRLFSQVKKRCNIIPVMAEVDRIVRPGGKLIIRDESGIVSEVENLLKSLHWEIRLTFSKDQEGILCAEKSDWRPEKYVDSS